MNSRYFDALIALIPAKFYLRRDDEGAAGTAGVGSEKYHKVSMPLLLFDGHTVHMARSFLRLVQTATQYSPGCAEIDRCPASV